MPRTSKGPRLVWRDESRKADGSLRNKGGWFIRDGSTFVSAGGGQKGGPGTAQQKALADHIASKYQPARQRGRDPDQVLIADVVAIYLRDIAPKHASPAETSSRLDRILDFFGTMTLADINGDQCRAYASQVPTMAAARRQLEDLRAAIRHYHREGYSLSAPAIVLPGKPEARVEWLTRDQAAKLIRAAWRMRQSYKGAKAWRWTGRHVARFMLVAVYTGTRSAAICSAAIRPADGFGHVDLDRGVFFRRRAGSKKTNKRQPPVRLPSRLLAHMRRWASAPDWFGPCDSEGKPVRKISEHCIVEWNGKPVASIKKAFRSAREAAKLGPEITPHVFRHTAATWLMQAGVDPWEAAGFLGMTVETLINTYGHHHPDFQSEAAEKIASKRKPKNVVRIIDGQSRNNAALPHANPTEKPETNQNIASLAK